MTNNQDHFQHIWGLLSTSASIDSAIYLQIDNFDLGSEYLEGMARILLIAELRRRERAIDEAYEIISKINVASLDPLKDQEARNFIAKYFYCRGLLERERGHFLAAASDFLSSLEIDPTFAQSIFALQFTRLEPEDLPGLAARLELLVSSSHYTGLIAGQLFADWSYLLGDKESAMIRSYHAVKASAASRFSREIDHLCIPSYPEALIVGAPKCGTTSMAAWLSTHPQIFVHPRKELHFFDNRWERGSAWYRCQFPCFRSDISSVLRLEATPNYLQLPEAPTRVFQLMPQAKIIILLRHPLERAISWFHHISRQDGIHADLNQIVSAEIIGLSKLSGQEISGLGWHGTNCLAGSFYDHQINRWRSVFPDSQLLVLQMEKMLENPQRTWDLLTSFLGVNSVRGQIPPLPRLNAAPSVACQLSHALTAGAMQYLHGAMGEWHSAQ